MRSSTITAALFFACCSLAAVPAVAQDDDSSGKQRRYGKFYNGAFVDFALRGALTRSVSSDHNGWSLDAGLRQALVMHLLDTRLSYVQDNFNGRSTSTPDFTLHGVMVHGAFHPLYMALLLSDRLGYFIASWYLEAGVGAHYGLSNTGESDWGARFSLGTGLDFPITDPDNGWSLWLNGVYRFNWADFDFDAGREVNFHHHAFWGGISIRFNGLLF